MAELGDSSINSSALPYIPEVKNELIPKVGQEFDSLDECFSFYNSYAFEVGFSVRVNSSKKNNAGEVNRKEYVCCKEGEKVPSAGPIKRRRGLTREGCKARPVVLLHRPSSKYVVSIFDSAHNHPLSTPKKVHLLPSHRNVSLAKRALTKQLGDVNMPMCQQMSLFEVQAGGIENVGCTMRDLYNVERDKRKTLEGHDINLLHEHFLLEKEKNPSFTFQIEKDDDGRMTHCFWADATSRKMYKYFGDVVVFDTTYNTNRYSLIFAPILGVNHHKQTTLFGCGFLKDETADSFEWFFKEWLKAMPGKPPKMIITDQDAAMTKAFATVLPNTLHRYCIWHISMKFSEKLGPISYKEHGEDLRKCIWNSESPEQFDANWMEMINKANLSSNEWLNGLYKIRERWIPAYTRHIFSAGMTSSQRAEIFHAFFKRYVSKNNSLLDFVMRFKRAVSHIRHNELNLDHRDAYEKPQLKTLIAMEVKMSAIYKRTIFYKFQDQVFQSGAYVVTKAHKDDECTTYNVRRAVEITLRSRTIVVDKSSNYVTCTCKMFESEGIPCRHLLAYFSKKSIIALPDEYILRRWTTLAKASRVMDDLGEGVKEICDASLLVRRNRVFKLACNVVEEAILTEETTKVLVEGLESIRKSIATMHISQGDPPPSTPLLGGQSSIPFRCQPSPLLGGQSSIPFQCQPSPLLLSQQSILEPYKVRAKGCGKHLKGGKEKAMKSTRHCTSCGATGHDKRTCPKLQNISSKDVALNDDDDEEEDIGDEAHNMNLEIVRNLDGIEVGDGAGVDRLPELYF